MNHTSFKDALHSLHWQSYGIHFLIAFLKFARDSIDFISSGTYFHIFGPTITDKIHYQKYENQAKRPENFDSCFVSFDDYFQKLIFGGKTGH